jgi:hypothetical protein
MSHSLVLGSPSHVELEPVRPGHRNGDGDDGSAVAF